MSLSLSSSIYAPTDLPSPNSLIIIRKGKQYQSNWYTTDGDDDRKGWLYACSENRWIVNELGVKFIKTFNRARAPKTKEGEYRLLIMGNHNSHVS